MFFFIFVENKTLNDKNNTSTLTDEELLLQYQKSEHTEYLGLLYNRYIPLLYGLCLKYLHNEECARNTVILFFKNIFPKVRECEVSTFRAWLYSEVKNYCFQILLKENKEIPLDFIDNTIETDEVLELLCDENDNSEQMQILRNCLERLPDGQRISITYFFMKGMSYADIVEKTGYSLNAVKSNIRNGKRNLKICMKKHSR